MRFLLSALIALVVAMVAPVEPMLTSASALPALTSAAQTVIDAFGLRRSAMCASSGVRARRGIDY
jgi:hypothetical protein